MLRAWPAVSVNPMSSPAKLCKFIIIVITMQGHAFEARLYAESVANNFLPATGSVRRWQVPINASFFDSSSTVRIDSGVSEGDAVSSLTLLCIVSSILTLPLRIASEVSEADAVSRPAPLCIVSSIVTMPLFMWQPLEEHFSVLAVKAVIMHRNGLISG